MCKVSVVMAVFNGERYLGEAINSILQQSMPDLELIIVNDGSTDRTYEIAEQYAKVDNRVKLVNRKNSGRPSFPRNDGIAVSTADYICFLDYDDLYEKDRIDALVDGLDRHQDWLAVFHDVRYIDEKGVALPHVYLADLDFLNTASPFLQPIADDWFACNRNFFIYQAIITSAIHTSAIMIAKNRLPTGFLHFDTSFPISDDIDLWLRLGLQGKLGFINRVLSAYRQHQESITRNREKLLLDRVQLLKHHYQRVASKLPTAESGKLRKKVAASMGELAYYLRLEQRYKEAEATYLEAFSWCSEIKPVSAYFKTIILRLWDWGQRLLRK